jgi:aryl-alcohol dehydrogenase-like predicted oxidoreductase
VIYHRSMQTRRFGRLGWQVSEIGYGMWGMGGWSGSDDAQSLTSLDQSVASGVNFFDTAYAYGDGHSEQLLAQTLRAHAHRKLYVATKVPPKNRRWPGSADTPISDVFPYDYIVEMTEKSLKNLGVERLHLQQLHVWDDTWASDEGWQRAAEDLKAQGKIDGFGISVNRWQPANVVDALETGKVDAVQVVYNVFDQNPEDVLFPTAQRLDVAIIARVPFDEGSLTGKMSRDMTFPSNDWRSLYFTPDNLRDTLDRVDALQLDVPAGMTVAELALRFILEHPVVSTTIPGMRKTAHVAENTAVSDGRRLGEGLMADLRKHRWDRTHVIP